jgi:NADP-dependent 3-hydroxy acid dehydrogenase YdfG
MTFLTLGDDVIAVARQSADLAQLCEETAAVPAALDLRRPTELPPPLAELSTVLHLSTRSALER